MSRASVKFAYGVPNVSGGLVTGDGEQRTDRRCVPPLVGELEDRLPVSDRDRGGDGDSGTVTGTGAHPSRRTPDRSLTRPLPPFSLPFPPSSSFPKEDRMATVLSVSGSPSVSSRTNRLLRHLDQRLIAQGHRVVPLDVRTIPAEALLGADFRHPAIVEARELFARADGVVVGTPIYKAAYSGVLKALLDLLPQYALTGKTVLPLATGGSTAHVLAIDYALRPVLNSMGAAHIVQGWFTLDKDITVHEDGSLTVAPGAREALTQVVDQFSAALGRTPLLAATG